MKTARDFQRPPTTWLHKGADGSWTDTDTLLTLALTIYESEHLCSECGNPKTLCRSGKELEVATDVCGGLAAVERWQKDNEKTPKEPGAILALRLAGADGDGGMSFVKFDDEK